MNFSLKILFYLGFAVVVTSNVESSDVKALIYKNIDYVKKKLEILENEVKDSIGKLQENITSLTTSALEDVDTTVATAQRELAQLGLSKACRSKAQDKLGNVKDNFIMDILNCKRNQEMVTDIEKIVYAGKDLMDYFVTSTANLIKGFESCLTFNPFEMGFCLTKESLRTGKLLVVESAEALEFTVAVSEDSVDLLSTTIWCIKNANSTTNQAVESILKTARECHDQ